MRDSLLTHVPHTTFARYNYTCRFETVYDGDEDQFQQAVAEGDM